MTLEEMLQAPFTDEVKQRPGRGGMTFDYIDARTTMQRMDDTVGLVGWEFHIKGILTEVRNGPAVHGSLTIHTADGPRTHEDVGYPNGPDDEEPLKSAASDALKRCAVHIGVGRHLYFDATPQQGTRPVVAQRAPQAPVGDLAEWSCPEHGTQKVKHWPDGGISCGVQGGSNTNAKGYCKYRWERNAPVEARPKPATEEVPWPTQP